MNTTEIRADRNNRLLITHRYRENAPKGARADTVVTGGKNLRKLYLDGRWSLTEDHDLKFHTITSKGPYCGKSIILRGEIVRTGGNSLVFRVRKSDNISGLRSGSIELKGIWRADKNNRITFRASKSSGRYDVLRFEGSWSMGKGNELIYKYENTKRKTLARRTNTIVFRGRWDLGAKTIVYRVEGTGDSFFRFRASLQSRSLRAAEGAIKYQVGVEFRKAGARAYSTHTVCFFGKWKLNKDLSASFILSSSKGSRPGERIGFEIEHIAGKKNTMTYSFVKKKGEPLGIEVEFRRTIRDDAQLFLSLSRYAGENKALAGIDLRF